MPLSEAEHDALAAKYLPEPCVPFLVRRPTGGLTPSHVPYNRNAQSCGRSAAEVRNPCRAAAPAAAPASLTAMFGGMDVLGGAAGQPAQPAGACSFDNCRGNPCTCKVAIIMR